jgi:hypothetical protein
MCPHSSELAKATANPLETSDIIIVDIKECRRDNQKRTSQRNYRVHKRKKNKTKTQHNMCWIPLFVFFLLTCMSFFNKYGGF